MNNFLKHLPVTAAGANLKLTEEQENLCRVVYRNTEENRYIFFELWKPEKEYSGEFVIVPLRSVYKGITAPYPAGTRFANIIGSSHDNRPVGKWIEVLQQHFPASYRTDICCTDGFIYDSTTVTDQPYLGEVTIFGHRVQSFQCGGSICGGHILANATNASEVVPGSEILLFPICTNHNIACLNTHQWGAGFYMRLAAPMIGARMKGYLKL